MDFYEELGLKTDATEEDIRRSHRRLIKLLHPDGQEDPELKALAELQLRRINGVVDLLYDAERRREYDQRLRKGDISVDPTHLSSFSRAKTKLTWRSLSFILLSLITAIVLTILGIRFWADHVRSAPGSRPTEIAAAPPAQSTPAQADPAPASSTTVAVVPTGEPTQAAKLSAIEGTWEWTTEDGSKGKLEVQGSEPNLLRLRWRLLDTRTRDSTSGRRKSGTAVLAKPAK
jgi:DnaJ domain